MVLNKIKPESIGICEKMEADTVNYILEELFPRTNMNNTGGEGTIANEEPIPEVTEEEIEGISKRALKKGMRAPGPDGIPARLVVEAHRCSSDTFIKLYNRCLEEGKFPKRWKRARLVLIKKDGKPDGEPSSYRPLCLLNEQGKMFERIIKTRIENCMNGNSKGLSKYQYGFIKGEINSRRDRAR